MTSSTPPTDPISRTIEKSSNVRRGAIRYTTITDAIAEALKAGRLTPGDRLPPRRHLAASLGVAVGTVNRAYEEAEREGLVFGQVGRGTFVSRTAVEDPYSSTMHPQDADFIDLTINRPSAERTTALLRDAFDRLRKDPELHALMGHHPVAGRADHRMAGAQWINRSGLDRQLDDVVICNGVQHGLTVALGAFSAPGDLVVTESLNYPGIRLLKKVHGLQIQGAPIDELGLVPDALEDICRERTPRFLLCSPNLHNPTSATMSEERRDAIAEVSSRHDLIVIENDISGPLLPHPDSTIASRIPERTVYVTGTSKSIAAGMRVGYITGPRSWRSELVTTVQATTWMTSPLVVEIVSRWIVDGTVDTVLSWQRSEAGERQAIANEVLSGFDFRANEVGYQLWLYLPEPWRSDEFVRHVWRRGIAVMSAEEFTIDRKSPPHAVRISLGGENSHEAITAGLRGVREVLAVGPRLEEVAP